MKKILACIITILALWLPTNAWATGAAHQSEEQEALYCVPQCLSRSITGMCLNYGRDFCTPYELTACIPHCGERSITGMCLRYGPDFCGVEPECQPYCEERTINGTCRRYGADACVSW